MQKTQLNAGGQKVRARMSQRWCASLWPVKMYSSQLWWGGVGGRDRQLLKHVVKWSDAEGTICCLAIKHHPHKDWAVANVKEIKATANHQQKWWSTLHDPRCTSMQPTQAGFIPLTSHCVTAALALHWNQRFPARTSLSAVQSADGQL